VDPRESLLPGQPLGGLFLGYRRGMREYEARAKLLARTLEVWQPRTSRKLTREDARQIVENVTGFASILLEWEMASRQEATSVEPQLTAAAKPGKRRQ
jgi:hypothetical protein